MTVFTIRRVGKDAYSLFEDGRKILSAMKQEQVWKAVDSFMRKLGSGKSICYFPPEIGPR